MPGERGPKDPRGSIRFGGELNPRTSISGETGTPDEPGYEKTEIARPFDMANSIEEIMDLVQDVPDLRNTEGQPLRREFIISMLRLIQKDLDNLANNDLPKANAIAAKTLEVFTTNEGLRDAVVRVINKIYTEIFTNEHCFDKDVGLQAIIKRLQLLRSQNEALVANGLKPIVLRRSDGQAVDIAAYINRLNYIQTSWLPSRLRDMRPGISDDDFNFFIQSSVADATQGGAPFTNQYGLRTAVESAIRLYFIQNRFSKLETP